MGEELTAVVVQRYLDELADDSPAEPIVRTLRDQAVRSSSFHPSSFMPHPSLERVRQLVDEIFDCERTPEEACAGCPVLLEEIRQRSRGRPSFATEYLDKHCL